MIAQLKPGASPTADLAARLQETKLKPSDRRLYELVAFYVAQRLTVGTSRRTLHEVHYLDEHENLL